MLLIHPFKTQAKLKRSAGFHMSRKSQMISDYFIISFFERAADFVLTG